MMVVDEEIFEDADGINSKKKKKKRRKRKTKSL